MSILSNIIIEATELEIGYRNSGINFPVMPPMKIEVNKGELTGVIGRNGVGKSTLLRTLSGLQPGLKGYVRLAGTNINEYKPSELAKIVSFVSTENIRIHNFSISELVALGRFPYTNWLGRLDAKDKSIIEMALELTGLKDMRHRDIFSLSDGEKQKAMIARALAQDTPVIIMDEPTAFLDLPSRYEIIHLLRMLSIENKKTIVFSTHDLQMAMNESDCLWVLTNEGLNKGAPEDLVFNKVFHKLFLNSCINFDERFYNFRLKRNMEGYIGLTAAKKYYELTANALERIGLKAVTAEREKCFINVSEENGMPVWSLTNIDNTYNYYSVYDLINKLKSKNK